MTLEQLNNSLKEAIESIHTNWARNGEVEEIPNIVAYALDEYRKAIINYLSNAE